MFEGNKSLSLDGRLVELLWVPDTFIVDSKKSFLHDITVENRLIRIFPNGTVLYALRWDNKQACWFIACCVCFFCSNRQWKVGQGMEKKLAEGGNVVWIWNNVIAKQGAVSILLLGHWTVWVQEHVICQYKERWAIKPTQVLLASFQHLLLCVQGLNVCRALGKLLKRALAFWIDIGPSRQVVDRKVIDDPKSEFVQLF